MYAHHLARLIIMRASFSRAEQPPFWRVVIHSNQAYSCVFLNGIKLKKYFARQHGIYLFYIIKN